MTEQRLRLYGPRMKVLAEPDGSLFTLLLDEFDNETQESKIVTLQVPRGQLEEWADTFSRLLGVN
jgi:hypothetical protein